MLFLSFNKLVSWAILFQAFPTCWPIDFADVTCLTSPVINHRFFQSSVAISGDYSSSLGSISPEVVSRTVAICQDYSVLHSCTTKRQLTPLRVWDRSKLIVENDPELTPFVRTWKWRGRTALVEWFVFQFRVYYIPAAKGSLTTGLAEIPGLG